MTETIKKWEFVSEDTIIFAGRILTRIRALIDYPNDHVKAGQFGGYIEKPENLGDWGWVGDNAKVFGNGEVHGDGLVYGDGVVRDHGQVCDNGRVYGNGQVYGNGVVCGNGRIYDNGIIYGEGLVCDNGRVYGEGQVFGCGVVCNRGQVLGRGRISSYTCISGDGYIENNDDIIVFNNVGSEKDSLTAHRQKDGSINLVRGCYSGSIDEFLSASAETHRDLPDIKREYELIIEVIKHRFKLS